MHGYMIMPLFANIARHTHEAQALFRQDLAATTNSYLDAWATQGSSSSRRTAPQRLATPGSPCIPNVTSHFPGSYRNAPFYFYPPRASGRSTVAAQLRCRGSPPAGGTDGGSPFEWSSARPSSTHDFQRACCQARLSCRICS